MLTLNDGRSELWQWDTGRTLSVDADCSQVHFSNKVFGRSIDVDVANGVAIIPDVLLQTDKDLNVWAFVGTAENGYTKISKTFRVNHRNKPADYVFTPVEQTTIAEIAAIAQSVRDDADAGLFNGTRGSDGGYYTPAVTQPDVNTIRMSFTPSKEDMPAVADTDIPLSAGGNGLTTAQVKALDGMFKICAFIKADVSEEYNAFRTAFDIEAATITGISATYSGGNVTAGTSVDELTGIVVTANYSDGSKQTVTGYTLSGTIAEGSNTITVTYEGMTTTFTVTGVAEEVTLTSISATYSGGDVAVGTAVTDLTGLVVTAHYSDGTSETVTGYTLSGTIAEGSNTISVSYGGATTTFTVTGVAESAGDGGYNENVAWEFEWYASSGVAPDGLTGSQGAPRTTFAENNEYMTATNAVLNFDYTGTSTLEVTACFADAQYNRPQIEVSNATHAGVKLYMSETTDTLMSSVTGSAAAVSTDPTYRTNFKTYRIVNNNGEYALYIDGVFVTSGTGRTNDSYIEGTGIFCGTYSIQLKNIKFSKSV